MLLRQAAPRAATIRPRRNIRLGFADDSDEELDARASALCQASVAKLYGIHQSKRRRVFEVSSVAKVMDSDDEEETNTLQASSRTPRKIKTQWQEIKVYDRSKDG